MMNKDNVEYTKSKSKAKLLFILAGIGIVMTIIFGSLHFHWKNVTGDADLGVNGYYGYWLAQSEYESNIISRSEFKEIEKEFNSIKKTRDVFKYISFASGGITIIILITGVALKIKEKGGIEFVD